MQHIKLTSRCARYGGQSASDARRASRRANRRVGAIRQRDERSFRNRARRKRSCHDGRNRARRTRPMRQRPKIGDGRRVGRCIAKRIILQGVSSRRATPALNPGAIQSTAHLNAPFPQNQSAGRYELGFARFSFLFMIVPPSADDQRWKQTCQGNSSKTVAGQIV